MILALPLLLAVAAAEPAQCNAIDREYILVGDVAAIVPAFSRLPADFNLGYAPLSGLPRILRGVDLQNIAKNRGIELPAPADLCFKRRTFVPNVDQIREAIRTSLAIPNATIEVSSSSQHPAPSGELVFPREGVQSSDAQKDVLWHGYVRYGDNQRFSVWAKVRISAPTTRVVAVTSILPRKPIQANQVRLENCDDSPFDDTVVRNLDEVVGFLSKSSLRSAGVIRKTQIERPPDVARGDLVTVHVFEGAAHLSMEARAQQAGVTGATILVRNPSSGKDFSAQVTGKDQVTIGQMQ